MRAPRRIPVIDDHETIRDPVDGVLSGKSDEVVATLERRGWRQCGGPAWIAGGLPAPSIPFSQRSNSSPSWDHTPLASSARSGRADHLVDGSEQLI
jgi:hypothetical protein